MKNAEIREFSNLVQEYQAGLRAFVRSLGAYSHAVDDITQEAFLVAWRKMGEFDPEKDFGAWLRGIARHQIANERRKSARRSRILSERLSEILDETMDTDEPIDAEASLAQIVAMKECLEAVPENTRSLLIRRYQSGELAPALARQTDMSVVAIRQALSRVRRAVKNCIEEKLGVFSA